MLTIVIILSTVILFVPSITAEQAKQSAWIVPILASSAGVVTLWLVTRLGKRFPSNNLPQYSQLILGKFFGKILIGWYSLVFLFVAILVTRQFTEFISITLLHETPMMVISFAFILVGIYATSKGLEVIARINQFILPLLLTALIVGFILGWLKIDLDRLLPLLEGGITPIVMASWIPASWFGEVIFLAFIFTQVNKPQEIFQKGLIGLLIAAGIMAIMTLFTIAIFGAKLTSTLTFPFWSAIRFLEFGIYVQRLESILVIVWITSMIVKISIFLYLAGITMIQLIPIMEKTIWLPLGGLVVISSVYGFKNIEQFIKILRTIWPTIGLLSEIGFPFLLLIVANLRGKKEGNRGVKK